MKCFVAALSLLCVASLASVAASARDTSSGADNRQPYRIIGYVSDAKVLPPVSAHKLDVINFAFAKVNPAHEVHLPGDTAPKSLAALVALRKSNPELKVLLSIGGWTAGNFSEAALTADARKRFADTAVALMRKHDLDGLDIDWEYPAHPGPGISYRPEDRQNFTALLQVLRSVLDAESKTTGRPYLLTIAAADGEAARGLELARIAPLLDWINLMTYDFYGSGTPITGHHAALYRARTAPADARNAARAVDAFLRGGVPARKLNVGLAFYGRTFGDVTLEQDGLYQHYGSDGGYVDWRTISSKLLKDPAFVRHWDATAQAAWLWNKEQRRMISYEDPQAVRAKARFVRERGLGGVMYWEQSTDPEEELLDIAREALTETTP